ncbi:hypothetical protein BaRGS_00026051, partial [Batillaria attramentaria]
HAYKEWVCATTIPYYIQGRHVPPCPSFCQQVEAMCPFFTPKKDTHAGDPSFICKDPGIERHVDHSPCFQLCHVVSKDDIRSAYCGSPNATCPDMYKELHCPDIRLPAHALSDNETGSHNATSAATGSAVLGNHVTRTAVALLLVIGGWMGVCAMCGTVVTVWVGVGVGLLESAAAQYDEEERRREAGAIEDPIEYGTPKV